MEETADGMAFALTSPLLSSMICRRSGPHRPGSPGEGSYNGGLCVSSGNRPALPGGFGRSASAPAGSLNQPLTDNMVQRRRILEALTRARLADLATEFGLAGLSGKSKDAVVQAIAGARAVKTASLLETLSRDELKSLCRTFGLDDGGRDKQSLIARLAGSSDGQAVARREVAVRGQVGTAQQSAAGRRQQEAAKPARIQFSSRKRRSPSMARSRATTSGPSSSTNTPTRPG